MPLARNASVTSVLLGEAQLVPQVTVMFTSPGDLGALGQLGGSPGWSRTAAPG